MAPNFSKITSRTDVKIALAASAALSAWVIRNSLKSSKNKNVRPGKLSPEEQIQYMIKERNKKDPKAQVDARFIAELKALWKIMMPSIWSKESGFMTLIALSLISRSMCDLWLIQHTTLVEGSIITMNHKEFRRLLTQFFIAMPVISLVNNVLKWSIGELKLRLRTNLTLHLYEQYLKGFTYYQVSNLDNRISNADQLLTTDIEKFCDTVVDLYSNISKPMLDISIYLYRLTVNLGASTPGIMMAYLLLSGVLLTYLRRPTDTNKVDMDESVNPRLTDVPEIPVLDPGLPETTDVPAVEHELDPEILSALGEPSDDTPEFGENIHETLAQRWQPILKRGLLKEAKDKLLKEYLVPSNCPLLQAPNLNAEISAAITDMARNRDKKMELSQQLLGAGITAVNRAMTLLITGEEKIQAIKMLSDGCRILTHLHHTDTQARIKMVTPGLEKSFLNVIKDNERDSTLFGLKLSEKIKASKAIEKQGLQIKKTPVPQKPSHTVQSTVTRPRYQENWPGPSRYLSNRGGRGGQRRQAPAVRKAQPAAQTRYPNTNKMRAQAQQ